MRPDRGDHFSQLVDQWRIADDGVCVDERAAAIRSQNLDFL